jgi:UDP-N-acetylglucosamine--N-acetylmuramyl-(pentapeptide) pyrophosphoryl-undecaprenol N-acetylglucosamine transferase
MELAMSAATVAVSRAGASSLAELAAMRLPSVLIPYPHAADNHQWFNARALTDAGAALLLEQREATGDKLAGLLLKLVREDVARTAMSEELARWHSPHAAGQIADSILALVRVMNPGHTFEETASRSGPAAPLRDVRSAVS